MEDINSAQHLEAEDLIKGIKNNKSYQIKLGHYTPLINNLEIRTIFKDKAGEEGAGVTDFIYWIVQVLKEDLERLAVNVQNAGLMEPVKLQNKGQPSHITGHEPHTKYTYVLTYLRTRCTDVLKY